MEDEAREIEAAATLAGRIDGGFIVAVSYKS